ncbi:MAG: NAD(P)H-dependent glycerol-3-phosphate dehydrogenase, partial [Myxococcota bacterium]|nr:NAD(P)H-dependent glycerol-3-phosphate dehydrogenase [Myxococcota bacterium]
MKVAVLGAGSWGTALAIHLARNGHEVGLWSRDPVRAQDMQRNRENVRYLPGVSFEDGLVVDGERARVLDRAELVVTAVPSQSTREVMTAARDELAAGALICTASKGIENDTLATMDEVLRDVLPPGLHLGIVHLAGPSFAREVASGLPTAVVLAGRGEGSVHHVAEALHGPTLRVYTTDDVVGAEVGGATKNVMAIACGMADGIGLGLNARAAIITRGLAEITRLAVARGG